MQFVLSLKMSGTAFEQPDVEVARLLREAAEQIETGEYLNEGDRRPLMDVNGNRCGGWEVIRG